MQQAYALFAAYNLVRRTLQIAVHAHGLMCGAPAHQIPALYQQLLQDIAQCRLDRPRRSRQYPRVVKRKMSNYKLQGAHHGQRILNFVEMIRIGA